MFPDGILLRQKLLVLCLYLPKEGNEEFGENSCAEPGGDLTLLVCNAVKMEELLISPLRSKGAPLALSYWYVPLRFADRTEKLWEVVGRMCLMGRLRRPYNTPRPLTHERQHLDAVTQKALMVSKGH